MKVLIIGGGIAGPVTAMALQRAGIDVEVFEAHDGPAGHLGLFLGLAANGLRVLRQLDLLTPVLAEDTIPTPKMRFDSTTGKKLATVPAGSLEPDTPSFTVMRGALQGALAKETASRGIAIRYGKRFVSCSQTSDGVLVRFADGTVARGDVLVGADGIHSSVRSFVCPDAPTPSYTGLLNLGGVAHHSGVPSMPGVMRMVWGRRAFFGYTVRPDGEAWWFANVGREREPERGELAEIGTPEWKRFLTELFRDDPPALTRMVEATELIGATPIHDMPTLPSWHRDRAVVIGDAAHAVSPSAGQGASMALEDAVVLAKCLRDIHRPQAALDRFVELRRPRAERIVAMGRRRGTYKAPRNRATRFVRDLLMPLVFRLFATERSMSWIYDHEIPWNEPVANRPGGGRRSAHAASLVALLLAVGLGAAGCSSGPNVGGNEEFVTPLPIPPLIEGRLDANGRRIFDLEARDGSREFLPGVRTATRGVNGPHLAPTLRMSRGDEVVVHLTNALDEATTMHWHGMELPAVMDGGPHQMIAPGSTWRPTWTVRQPSATLWYHPHPHGETEAHVYSGMVGMLIIDDEESARLELPSEYGVDDIPILVQDVAFDADGTLVRRKPWYNQVGPLGRTILVNGATAPRLELRRERVRLRLLNASVARVFNFGFSDDREFLLVASDGGLLATPHPTRRMQLSPGERADIVVTLDPGERTVLRSFPQELNTDFVNHRLAGGNDSFEVMALQAGTVLQPSPDVPPVLTTLSTADASVATVTRSFQVSSSAINGRSMDMTRIDARVQAGANEIWEVEGIAVPHNLHIHGVRFRVLDVDGAPPPPPLAGWKDTVYLEPDRVTRLLIQFPEHPDAVPFMFHCHFLRHEDDGAMGQFLVVGEG